MVLFTYSNPTLKLMTAELFSVILDLNKKQFGISLVVVDPYFQEILAMFSHEIHYLVCKEISKDRQRDAARYQLIRTALLQRPDDNKSLWRMTGRIGTQLVKWGSKLQRYAQGQHQTITQQG